MNLGSKIRELRKLKGLTLEEFSKKTNLSASYVSYLEREKRQINFQALEQISAGLEIPIPVLALLSATHEELSFLDGNFDLSTLQSSLSQYLLEEYEKQ